MLPGRLRWKSWFASAACFAYAFRLLISRSLIPYPREWDSTWLTDDPPVFHQHIGIYAYRRSALERFVSLRPSPLEEREKLEQLRALEDGMRIDVALVDTVPLGVDTPADLERARELLGP